MRQYMTALAMLSIPAVLWAQDALGEEQKPTEILKIDVMTRVDWQLDNVDSHTVNSNTGFEAKYLGFRIDGIITDGLTYSWRQRLNKAHSDGAFLNATDWIYLNYAVDGWNFQAGKEVVAIGGWEYDRHPIDVLGGSVFWNNIPCYDLGVSVGYNLTSSDCLTLQATQSPFFTKENRNLYAYNLMWSASHGVFHPLWSANMVEYDKGKYISYLALGNRFDVENVSLELDFMNRAASGQTYFFKDCSVMAELGWRPDPRWRIHGKYTYDVNRTHKNADYAVTPGTELSMIGGGVEFYPLRLKRTDLRLHAACYYSWGTNANTADLMQDKTVFFNVGLTWHMNVFTLKK
ncbi:MAG: porin [Bacteroidales bacterium]|nr:porin [Bacteroidales bacterium]